MKKSYLKRIALFLFEICFFHLKLTKDYILFSHFGVKIAVITVLLILNSNKMSKQNLVSASISDAEVANALNQINAMRATFPFLINLSKEERKNFRKMGPKSVSYVKDTFVAAKQFPECFPQSFRMQEFEKDSILIEQLYPLFVAVQSLNEALNDTVLALGSDSMKEADEVYGFLKIAAKNDASAKTIVDQIAKRFKGQGGPKKQS